MQLNDLQLQLESLLDKSLCLVPRSLSFRAEAGLGRNSLSLGSSKMTAVPGRNQNITAYQWEKIEISISISLGRYRNSNRSNTEMK